MQTKLTLRLEDQLIIKAKKYAADSGKSVSELVSDYFFGLSKQNKTKSSKSLPPLTRALTGLLKDSSVSTKDYDQYREKKYL